MRHGMRHSAPYYAWRNMMTRCYNQKNHRYKYYGARGIKVCEKWHNFAGFWEDMRSGYQPGLTLERDDNDGHYELSNCRWAPWLDQARNKRSVIRITDGATTISILEFSTKYGIPKHTLHWRIRKGWPLERLAEPIHTEKRNKKYQSGTC